MSARLPARYPLLKRSPFLMMVLLAACGGGGEADRPSMESAPPVAIQPPAVIEPENPGQPDASTSRPSAPSDLVAMPTPITHPAGQPTPQSPAVTVDPPSEQPAVPLGDTSMLATLLRPQPPAPSPTEPPTQPDLGVPVGTELHSPGCSLHYRAETPPRLGSGTDPHLGIQWHLHNDGTLPGTKAGEDLRVRPVWASGHGSDGTGRGRGIRIAVIDDGLEVTHPDLWPNIVPDGSYNYLPGAGYGNPFPMPCDATLSHGTAVAGVIAARDDNGIGGSGVAPRASLFGLNAIVSGEDEDVIHALSHQLDKNHIYNNSWGAVDSGHFQRAPRSFGATISHGLKHGRGGLGAIYVFSAGNGGCLYAHGESACQGTDLSTYDGHVTQLGTIAVCATDATGQRPFYSEPGANLLVCAPSASHDPNRKPTPPSIATTVPEGQYTAEFGGTSAAAPMVSGVVALMLEANPQLSWRDVRLILARSARQVNPQDAGWTQFGGLNFHHEFGFGVVDAEAAVKLARQWTSVGGSESLKQCEATANISRKGERIAEVPATSATELAYGMPAEGGLSKTLSLPADCGIRHVEHVQLTLSTGHEDLWKRLLKSKQDHPDNGNLHITLTSPSGQTSTVATPRPCYKTEGERRIRTSDCESLQNFSIGLSRHLEEPAVLPGNPNWLLKIVDRNPGNAGHLLKASITVYGR